jgi:pimeloyl-ACP methyl ester carboxylesterase
MQYVSWGAGPRTVVWIPGGPGSELPTGMMLRSLQRQLAPLVDAGFTVWVVSRRRGMPPGHSVADMAADYAQVIATEFGGEVDLVAGLSYGGIIAQYLAANHRHCFEHLALVLAACEVSAWGKDVDLRMALALGAGDRSQAGEALAEYVMPGDRVRPVRRLLGPVLGLIAAGHLQTGADVLIEGTAEVVFDSREVLPQITVPVLLIAAERDLFFPKHLVAETADLIPDCTLVWLVGVGHLKAATSNRIAGHLLAFVNRNMGDQGPPGLLPGP